MHKRILRIISSPFVHWLVFIVAGAAIYGFTLSYPFVFDDRVYVMKNIFIRGPEAFINLLDLDSLVNNYLHRLSNPDMTISFVLRPVAYLTFFLNYLFGGNSPAGFRLVNIALHIVNAIMLYSLLSFIIRHRSGEAGLARFITIPFFAALIFLLHPLQTQSVTYITQRFASLGTCFYLATMLLYLHSVYSSTGTRKWTYIGSVIALLMGLMTRESVLTAPFALVMAELILMRSPLRPALLRLAAHFCCLLLIPLRLFSLAKEIKETNLLFNVDFDLISEVYTRSEYAITQLRVILSYFRLFILPYNQNFDPDYPLYSSLLNPEIIISILIWTAFILAGVQLLRRKERTICTDLTAFSIFWFPLALSVSSSFLPLTDLMFEHRTYLPSLAFFTGMIAYLHHRVSSPEKLHRQLFIGCLLCCSALYGVLTVQRNQVYSSRISIWKDTVRKSPNKNRPFLALGNSYLAKQQYAKAEFCYKKAMELDPEQTQSYVGLGNTYVKMGLTKEAIKLYRVYLATYPPDKRIITDLSVAYAKLEMLPEAIEAITPLLAEKPDDAHLLSYFAELNLRAGNRAVARHYLAAAKRADKKDPTADISRPLQLLNEMLQEADATDISS